MGVPSMADETLRDLGPEPGDIEALIERYLGSRRITAGQADALLSELGSGGALFAPTRASSAAPQPEGSAAQWERRPDRRRYNTPFPQGLAGVDELPVISRGLRTPLPGFHAPVPSRSVAPIALTPVSAPPIAAEADVARTDDSFEIVVDDEVLELEADDLLIEDES